MHISTVFSSYFSSSISSLSLLKDLNFKFFSSSSRSCIAVDADDKGKEKNILNDLLWSNNCWDCDYRPFITVNWYLSVISIFMLFMSNAIFYDIFFYFSTNSFITSIHNKTTSEERKKSLSRSKPAFHYLSYEATKHEEESKQIIHKWFFLNKN